jgi:hypothetical protein
MKKHTSNAVWMHLHEKMVFVYLFLMRLEQIDMLEIQVIT